MKIGILLFGHLRSFRQTTGSFTRLTEFLSRHGDIKIFCHTWDTEESVTASWWKGDQNDLSGIQSVNRSELEKVYQPEELEIETSRRFDTSGLDLDSSVPAEGILSMLHSQVKVFHLMKNYEARTGSRFDLVIKSRFDLEYDVDDSFSEQIRDSAVENLVCLPTSNPYEIIGSYSDVFVIAGRQVSEKYFSFCENFREAVQLYNQIGYRKFLPEFCMSVYYREKKWPVNELSGLRVTIRRTSGVAIQINTDRNFMNNMPLCFDRKSIQVNREIVLEHFQTVEERWPLMVRKYLGWLIPGLTEREFSFYSEILMGKRFAPALAGRIAATARQSGKFTPNVFKGFLEQSVRNARYSFIKKFILVLRISISGRYGLFFFKVLWNSKKNSI